MGTQEVKLERAGEKSAVDGSVPVCSFIHINHNYSSKIFRGCNSRLTQATDKNDTPLD